MNNECLLIKNRIIKGKHEKPDCELMPYKGAAFLKISLEGKESLSVKL